MPPEQADFNKFCRQNLVHIKLPLYQRKVCGLENKFCFNKQENFPSLVKLFKFSGVHGGC